MIRRILKNSIALVFAATADFEIEGRENIPDSGPLLVVANHFNFLDPLAVIQASPWPLEFVGGAQTPNAPSTVGWISKLFGVIPTYRGTGSRETLLSSKMYSSKRVCWASSPKAAVGQPFCVRPAQARLFWPGRPTLASSLLALMAWWVISRR